MPQGSVIRGFEVSALPVRRTYQNFCGLVLADYSRNQARVKTIIGVGVLLFVTDSKNSLPVEIAYSTNADSMVSFRPPRVEDVLG